LWVGILIVAVSVVAGARLLAGADDTVGVWTATRDVGAGDTLESGDLVVRHVRFAEGGDLEHYFTSTQEPPADQPLSRAIGQGELVPRAALGAGGTDGLLQVPLPVDPLRVPPEVAAGSRVDVYLMPGPGSECGATCSRPVLTEVSVVSVSGVDPGFAATGARQLVVAVDPEDAAQLFKTLGTVGEVSVTVVRRG